MGNFKTGFENAPKLSTGGGGGFKTGFEPKGATSAIVPSGPVSRGGIAGGPATAALRKSDVSSGPLGWLGSKLGLAAHDIAQMPGGLYEVGSAAAHDTHKAFSKIPGYPHSRAPKGGYELPGVGKAFLKSSLESIEHPGRDPFATGLTLAPAVGLAGRVGEAGLAARAADVGAGESRIAEAAKAALRKHGDEPIRTIKHGGRLVKSDSGASMRIGGKETSLIPSRNAGVRLVQRGYDSILQRAMDKEQSGAKIGRAQQRIAAHGVQRVKGAMAEEGRIAQRLNDVPANMLDRSASRLRLGKLPRTARENQAALELTSTQTMPEKAALYHEAQANHFGREAELATTPEARQAALQHAETNSGVAQLYRRVAQRNLVHFDEQRPVGEQVHINPAEKHLAMTDERLAGTGDRGDQILIDYGQMTPHGVQTAINNPGLVRAGAEYNRPTPGKLGVPSHVLKQAEADVARIEKLHARAYMRAMGNPRLNGAHDLDINPSMDHVPEVKNLAGALSVAKDRLQALEERAARREQPTGFIGGEDALQGRTHISYRTSEKKASQAPARRVSSPVSGKPASPLNSHEFTGESIAHGLIPKDITGMKSRAFRQIVKHKNSVDQASELYRTGTTVSQGTGHEMLLGNPEAGVTLGKVGTEARQFLGQETPTFTGAKELSEHERDMATAEGIKAAREEIVRGWLNRAHEEPGRVAGVPAPEGYRFVDKRLAGDLQQLIQPPKTGIKGAGEKIGRGFDNVNSSITSATVYFKVGHSFTRGLTNAVTNAMQGSLDPVELAKTWQFEKDAKEAFGTKYTEFRERLLAAGGQMGYMSLPHAGTEGRIGRSISLLARKGSGFWAHGVGRFPGFDAPFRVNSLLYELRRVGYETPEQVSRALDGLQSLGRGMPAHEWSKISVAARRADREAISYDRLNQFEKSFLSRAIWFYPWVKGSTMFTLRSIAEHPLKMGTLGQLGVQGRERQHQLLGDVPSYEQGLIALGGGASPETVDMSTFSPTATAGQLLNIPMTPGGLANQLNPAAAALVQGSTGTNQYGEPSNSPWLDALRSLVAPTPEAQIADSFGRKGQNTSGRMFPGMTPRAELERYLLGPGLAERRVNRAALAKAAAREHAKRYTVYSGG